MRSQSAKEAGRVHSAAPDSPGGMGERPPPASACPSGHLHPRPHETHKGLYPKTMKAGLAEGSRWTMESPPRDSFFIGSFRQSLLGAISLTMR